VADNLIAGARPQPPPHDTVLHLVYRSRPTLGDKLQRLARIQPKYIATIESLVDYLLDTLKSA